MKLVPCHRWAHTSCSNNLHPQVLTVESTHILKLSAFTLALLNALIQIDPPTTIPSQIIRNPPMCCFSDSDHQVTEPLREINQDRQSNIQGTKVDTHLLWQSAHSLFSGSFIRASNICNIKPASQHLISKPASHSGRNSKSCHALIDTKGRGAIFHSAFNPR